jgi:putative acetyltransferase
MQNNEVEIKPYEEKFREQLLTVWEKSVLATHDFLDPADFISIKAAVHTINFSAFQVYCLIVEENVAGFIGVADRKVEMLFLDPLFFGRGFGKKLMDYALVELNANKVDVNEQNSNSVEFYKKLGFETYERTEKDDQGKNYPLLRMKLRIQKTES